jgi:hypothetical protein
MKAKLAARMSHVLQIEGHNRAGVAPDRVSIAQEHLSPSPLDQMLVISLSESVGQPLHGPPSPLHDETSEKAKNLAGRRPMA